MKLPLFHPPAKAHKIKHHRAFNHLTAHILFALSSIYGSSPFEKELEP